MLVRLSTHPAISADLDVAMKATHALITVAHGHKSILCVLGIVVRHQSLQCQSDLCAPPDNRRTIKIQLVIRENNCSLKRSVEAPPATATLSVLTLTRNRWPNHHIRSLDLMARCTAGSTRNNHQCFLGCSMPCTCNNFFHIRPGLGARTSTAAVGRSSRPNHHITNLLFHNKLRH